MGINHAFITQLKSLLENEKKLDFSNGSFFGGFHNFLLGQVEKLQDGIVDAEKIQVIQQIIDLASDYPNCNFQERAEIINKVEAALESLSKRETSASLYSTKINIRINNPISTIKQIGPSRLKLFEKLGIKTVKDLLYYFPRRYEDRSKITKINMLLDGQVQTVIGKLISLQELRPRKGLRILKATLADETGKLIATWFNQSYVKKILKPGKEIIVNGKVDKKFLMAEMTVQEFELIDNKELIHIGRIVPIYSLTERLSQKFLRSLIFSTLKDILGNIQETLPWEILKRYNFLPLNQALKQIHFPKNWILQKEAERRFIYEELFEFQMKLVATKKITAQKKTGILHRSSGRVLETFLSNLPFSLTGAQKRVISKIISDMESPYPMSRLVQGDVGSGKTIVAICALLKAVDSGFQGALMAPTEILAEQHFLNFKDLLTKLGVKVALLTGSMTNKEKDEVLQGLKNGSINIVIGTHALLQEHVKFKKLSLVVIDEQHRFGVVQRATLQEKGFNPDVLVMTATPIPRTLALTLYGDLDVSIIDELPPGRKPVMTRYVPESKRRDAYAFIKEEIKKGRQAYVVCPLIEESEAIEAEAAVKLQEDLQKNFFREHQVGLLHGKMSTQEKELVMARFYDNKIPILVSTTVIEVGVNVPNATIMAIEGVERFGLSQLHQLRGRIGRGEYKSYCLLLGNLRSDEAKARVKILCTTSDGFAIAEEDLKLRGPGDFFGTRQHGLPEFRIANLLRDVEILEICRKDALEMQEKYPDLCTKNHTLLI
ncbi:MAG: ATP-dependent DNA helicase RecG [Zhaonellaceae bacterium]|nr:ATP-dependent DNA helicase RecG [Clostridia bacterium]